MISRYMRRNVSGNLALYEYIVRGVYVYELTYQKYFVQTQISFHGFSHQSNYQRKYTLNEVSKK